MAIQISGTTVVNDSRQLQNIASADSTTQSTINSFVSGGDLVFPKGTNMSSISNNSSVSLAAGTYLIFYTFHTFQGTRTLTLPTSNVVGGLMIYYPNHQKALTMYGSSGWVQQYKGNASVNNSTSGLTINGGDAAYGWMKFSGTSTLSITGGSDQHLAYVTVD